ncbi:MAG TPA: 16S rRNA (cytosine(1402)-N(4))-methyltransferase RsmH [Candidatus Saccharimonadales bacterium]|nr:16S rRNA (cytosine(1402)-N(4))-methyltransferase RsmH [Candidatus Saccharimonadales bacterium]
MNNYHKSVLLDETIEGLNVRKGRKYIDATLGGGGHAGEIIEKGGIVLGIDTDADSLDFVQKNFQFPISNSQLGLARGNFRDIDSIAKENGFEEVAGIIFDLGVSSHQLDVPERGFSFQADGPLDMRMDSGLSVKARDLVNSLTKRELVELFTKLGEEHKAPVIAEEIIRARAIEPIITTLELVAIVKRAAPSNNFKINPATKVFQALRIAVNDEFNNLRESLPKAFELLETHGRLSVIAFHSLEDRIVKQQFRKWDKNGLGQVITKKPIVPSDEEIKTNNRSRSAKLRVIEKI